MNLLKDKKNLVILLLSALFLIRVPAAGVRFFAWVVSAIFLCFLLDFLLNKLFLKKYLFPKSAVISAFIVSGILDYHQPFFTLIIFSSLAVLSKHLIKYKGKHIFNPAGFGLFIAAVSRQPLTWNIESSTILIIIFGLVFAYFYKKFFHILGFLILFVALGTLAKIQPFGLISWFFLFVMLIEPKTSGYGVLRGALFGSIAGIASFLFFMFLPVYDPFVSSLFVANLFFPALELIQKK